MALFVHQTLTMPSMILLRSTTCGHIAVSAAHESFRILSGRRRLLAVRGKL